VHHVAAAVDLCVRRRQVSVYVCTTTLHVASGQGDGWRFICHGSWV
jgi:hypothetical protein